MQDLTKGLLNLNLSPEQAMLLDRQAREQQIQQQSSRSPAPFQGMMAQARRTADTLQNAGRALAGQAPPKGAYQMQAERVAQEKAKAQQAQSARVQTGGQILTGTDVSKLEAIRDNLLNKNTPESLALAKQAQTKIDNLNKAAAVVEGKQKEIENRKSVLRDAGLNEHPSAEALLSIKTPDAFIKAVDTLKAKQTKESQQKSVVTTITTSTKPEPIKKQALALANAGSYEDALELILKDDKKEVKPYTVNERIKIIETLANADEVLEANANGKKAPKFVLVDPEEKEGVSITNPKAYRDTVSEVVRSSLDDEGFRRQLKDADIKIKGVFTDTAEVPDTIVLKAINLYKQKGSDTYDLTSAVKEAVLVSGKTEKAINKVMTVKDMSRKEAIEFLKEQQAKNKPTTSEPPSDIENPTTSSEPEGWLADLTNKQREQARQETQQLESMLGGLPLR